uniref:Uncharacterized protein n=1 Tax=Oryza nivara TaxID=4536 RepID=A0A0E0FGD4_ORYNI
MTSVASEGQNNTYKFLYMSSWILHITSYKISCFNEIVPQDIFPGNSVSSRPKLYEHNIPFRFCTAVVKGYPSSRSHRRIWFVDDHKSGEIILEFNDRLNKWGVISLRSDVKVKKLSPGPQVSFPTHQSGYMPTSPSLLLPVPWIMIHERGKEKAYGRKYH